MSRIRNVKPEYFKHEKIGDLPRDIRLLFIGLWTLADLHGVFEWRPRTIKLEVFPWDNDITPERIESMLAALEVAELIRPFLHEGKKYAAIHDWLDHQAISLVEKKQRTARIEKDRDVYPEPPRTSSKTTREPTENCSGTVPEPTRNAGRHDEGRRTKDVVTSDVVTSQDSQPGGDGDGGYDPHDQPGDPEPPPADRRHLTTAVIRRVDGVDEQDVRTAAKAGSLVGVVTAFGANASAHRQAEWRRESDGLSVLMVLVLFADARSRGVPIREPSGFRAAREHRLGQIEREDADELLALYGLKGPTPAKASA